MPPCSARPSARTCAAPSSGSATARRSSSATRATAPTYRRAVGRRSTAPRAALLAHGVDKGDRVGIWAPNRFEWVVIAVRHRAHRRDPGQHQPGLQGGRARVRAEPVRRQPAPAGRAASARPTTWRCWTRSAPSARRCAKTIVLDDDWDAFLADGDARHATRSSPRARRRCSSTTRSTSSTRRARPALPKGATLSHHNILNNALLHRRARWRYSEHDRVCVPVPFYHCFGMVLGNLACIAHGACMVVPGEAFDAAAVLETVAGRALHVAVRRADDVHRRARPRRTSSASTSRACAPAIMAGAPCPVEVMKQVAIADAHARGDDRLRHDRDVAGLDPDRARRPAREARRHRRPRAPARRGQDRRPRDRRGRPARRRPASSARAATASCSATGTTPEATGAAIDAAAGCTPATWR